MADTTTPPSPQEVFKRYLEYAQGLGWFAGAVTGAAALLFTLRGEIQVLTVTVEDLRAAVSEIQATRVDARLGVAERDIERLNDAVQEERMARRRLADRVNRIQR